jgi:5'-nucleotidase
VVVNTVGSEVLVNQVGWAGIVLGRVDFHFSKNKKEKHAIHSTVKISK